MGMPLTAARFSAGAVALVSLLTIGAGVAALPAQASLARASAGTASVPGWRLTATGSTPHTQSILVSADAPAANNAWALGLSLQTANSQLDQFAPIAEHWAGQRWRPVPIPPAVVKKLKVADPFELTIRAADPSGAWIFQSSWLRWDGKQWHSGPLPVSGQGQKIDVDSAAVFGPADVWAFGGTFSAKGSHAYAARFNGHKWSQVAVPGAREIIGVSALSPADFWAVAGQPLLSLVGVPSAAGGSVLHWTGKKWTALKLPATLAKHADLTSVIARSDSDVWVGGAIRLHSAKGAFIPRPIAAHWDGRTWTVTELPGGSAHKNLTLSLAQDGNGGIWATGNCPSCQKFAPQLMWHWQHGRWTGPSKDLLDAKTHANYVTLAQVGQTSSVWAVGTVFSKPQWAIALYGKVPH